MNRHLSGMGSKRSLPYNQVTLGRCNVNVCNRFPQCKLTGAFYAGNFREWSTGYLVAHPTYPIYNWGYNPLTNWDEPPSSCLFEMGCVGSIIISIIIHWLTTSINNHPNHPIPHAQHSIHSSGISERSDLKSANPGPMHPRQILRGSHYIWYLYMVYIFLYIYIYIYIHIYIYVCGIITVYLAIWAAFFDSKPLKCDVSLQVSDERRRIGAPRLVSTLPAINLKLVDAIPPTSGKSLGWFMALGLPYDWRFCCPDSLLLLCLYFVVFFPIV